MESLQNLNPSKIEIWQRNLNSVHHRVDTGIINYLAKFQKILTHFRLALLVFKRKKSKFLTPAKLKKSEIDNELGTQLITGHIMVFISTLQNFRVFWHISGCRFWFSNKKIVKIFSTFCTAAKLKLL